MVIHAKIKPGSKKEAVVIDNHQITIKVKSPPVDGKANAAVINLLSQVLKIPKSHIQIASGENSRFKKINIDIDEDLGLLLLKKSNL